MTLSELIPWAIQASVLALVFALGLTTDATDLTYLSRRPSQLFRSLLSISLIMPFVAAFIVRLLSLGAPVGIVIFALALSPLPPLLPNKHAKAGGNSDYAISLLVTAAIFSIASIPLSVEVLERFLGTPLEVGPLAVAKMLLSSMLVPLGAGMIFRHFATGIAEKINGPLSRIASLLMLLALMAVLLSALKTMLALIGDGTLLALAMFIVAGVLIGHLLGGPDLGDRSVLAISTASRHPGVAMALISLTRPDTQAVLPILLLYLILNALLSAPYVAWLKRSGTVLPSV